MPNVKLVASDNGEVAVALKIAKMSKTVEGLMEALNMTEESEEALFEQNPIPLPNVTKEVLDMVVKWCEQHVDDAPIEEKPDDGREKCTTDIPEWDQEFFKMEQKPLFDLFQASNYMDIRGLFINISKSVANMLKSCKTAQEVRDMFHIVKDLTDEEEEKIRKENSWCDE